MTDSCFLEIRELHEFFEDWFGGRLANDDASFSRVASALAADFELISPRGVRDDRDRILAQIRGAHGKRSSLTISVEDLRARACHDDVCLVTYEERHRTPESVTRRISSAWFRRRADAPRGVEWVHLHETWLEAG